MRNLSICRGCLYPLRSSKEPQLFSIADEAVKNWVSGTMMVRRARSGQVQIIVVTSRQINLKDLVEDLVKKHPEIVTVALIKYVRSSEIYGEQTQRLFGEKRPFWSDPWSAKACKAPVQIQFEFQLGPLLKFESRAVKSGTLAEACFRDRPISKIPAAEFDAFTAGNSNCRSCQKL